MPRKPAWIHRIPRALNELSASGISLIDRAAFQNLFHVSPRQGVRLMRRLGAGVAGRDLVIEVPKLVDALERVTAGGDLAREIERHERLHSRLLDARRELAGRRIRIKASPIEMELASLPAGVKLTHGRLLVDFHDVADMLSKLLALSQAVMNDYPEFEQICGQSPTVGE